MIISGPATFSNLKFKWALPFLVMCPQFIRKSQNELYSVTNELYMLWNWLYTPSHIIVTTLRQKICQFSFKNRTAHPEVFTMFLLLHGIAKSLYTPAADWLENNVFSASQKWRKFWQFRAHWTARPWRSSVKFCSIIRHWYTVFSATRFTLGTLNLL